jgi:WhiB family redox-sensing transcriptional regulator
VNLSWQERAACRGLKTEVFFPRGVSEKKFDAAKAVCATCTEKEPCLKLVLHLEPFEDRWGVYGGLTPAERIYERKKRNGRRVT